MIGDSAPKIKVLIVYNHTSSYRFYISQPHTNGPHVQVLYLQIMQHAIWCYFPLYGFIINELKLYLPVKDYTSGVQNYTATLTKTIPPDHVIYASTDRIRGDDGSEEIMRVRC